LNIAANFGGWNIRELNFTADLTTALTFSSTGAYIDFMGVSGGASNAVVINDSSFTQTITTEFLHRTDVNTGMLWQANNGDIVMSANILQSNANTAETITIDNGVGRSVTFSGDNTYNTATSILAGTLIAASDTALGTTVSNTTVPSGATLELQNDITIAAGETLTNNGTLFNAQDDNTYAGVIAGSGGVDVSGGELTLTNTNTFTGAINLTGGALTISSQENLGGFGSNADLTLNGGTFRIDGGTVDNDDNNRTMVLGAGGGIIDTVSGSDTLIWDNNITGSGDLTKTGAGTFRFDDPTTFTGDLNANAGTVEFSGGDNRLNNQVDVTIASGATLDVRDRSDDFGSLAGAGTLTLGSSNILDDSMDLNVAGGTFTLASGITETIDQLNVSAGNLNVDGILTMNGGTLSGGNGAGSDGTLVLTAGNTLNITNDFDFGGTLKLTAGTALALSGGSTFGLENLNITGNSVIDFGSADANTLNLGSLTIGDGVTITVNNWISFQDLWTTGSFSGGTGAVTIDGRDANTAQITFTGFSPADTIWLTSDFGSNEITVPEPSSYGAILMGFGLIAWTLRRPRRNGRV